MGRSGSNTGSEAVHRLLTNCNISKSQSLYLMSLTISSLAYHSTLKLDKAILQKHGCLSARLHGIASDRKVAFTVNVDFFYLVEWKNTLHLVKRCATACSGCLQQISPLISVQNKINPVHDIKSCFLMIHCNITHPSMVRSSEMTPSFRFYKYCPVYVFLFSPMPATFTVHLILLDLITLTWCGNE